MIIILKHLAAKKETINNLGINIEFILSHFDKNVWNHPIIAV